MQRLETWLRDTFQARGLEPATVAAATGVDVEHCRAWQNGSGALAARDVVGLAAALGLQGAADDALPTWWDEAMRLKDDMSLKDLADHLGVSVGTLTSELRHRGVRRRLRVDSEEPGVAEADEQTPESRPGSKDGSVQSYFHLLGKVPDSEVARLAGVSVRTIASYRARNEIPGYTGPRRRPAPRGRRQSKVDDFMDLLGKVPDRVVADIAGMSLGAVRNYRIKHDLPAAGRMSRAEINQLVDAFRRGAGAEIGLAPTAGAWGAATPGGSGPAPDRTSGTAWRFRLRGDDEGFIVVAESLRHAVERATTAVGDESRIAGIEQLGPVLDLD